MMGHSHAVSGALGWLACSPLLEVASHQSFSSVQLAAGTVACAGAAILPDIDHPQATIAHTLGPVTHVVAKGVNLVSGGHRHATHSFFFAALMGLSTWGLLVGFGPQAAGWVMFAMGAFAIKGLYLAPPKSKGPIVGGIVVAAEAAGLVWWVDQYAVGGWGFLPWAVGFGCIMHLVGDCLTPERCPLLWPKKTRYGVGLIEHTGNFLEVSVLTPVMGLLVLVLIWVRFFAGHSVHLGPLHL